MDKIEGMDTSLTVLYERLGVPSTASEDEIRRAYRKLALRFHPDKNPTADPDVFQAINHAYDILGDPKKRAVYDRYGEFGVSMLGTVGGVLFDPEAADMICCLLLALTLLLILAVLFLIFIALRVDGIVIWSWPAIFIPLWLVMAGAGILVVIQISRGADALDQEDDEDEDLYDVSPEERQAAREAIHGQRLRTLRIHQAASALYFLLFLALAITIVLRLKGSGGFTLMAALFPYFLLEVLTGLGKAASVAEVIGKGKPVDLDAEGQGMMTASLTLSEKASVILRRFWWWTLRILFVILLGLRVDGIILVDWAAVFAPLYLVAFWNLCKLLAFYRRLRFAHGPDARKQADSFLMLGLLVLFLVGGITYTAIGLIVRKIENPGSVSAVAAASPLFVALGIMLCCSCCCLPCSFMIGPPGLSEMAAAEEGRIAGRGLRITDGTAPSDRRAEVILPGRQAWEDRRRKDRRERAWRLAGPTTAKLGGSEGESLR